MSGADVARWDGGGDSMVDIIDGGGSHALNADGGHARVLSGVNGGVVGGRFRGVSVCGCRLDEVTGDARLNDVGDYRREDAVRDRDCGLRASDSASLWARGAGSDEDGRVVLRVVGRDGSARTLSDAGARRVLAGRPSASEWDVESLLGSFGATFDRRAGEWMSGAGDVANPPSGWDDDMVPVVDDDDDE